MANKVYVIFLAANEEEYNIIITIHKTLKGAKEKLKQLGKAYHHIEEFQLNK